MTKRLLDAVTISMAKPAQLSPNGRNTSLLVVHGVGVEHAGASMLELAESLVAYKRLPVTLALEHFALEDVSHESDDTSRMAVFSAPALKVSAMGEQLRFVELFWGDLSHLKGSLIGVISGTFRLILGLRFLLIPLRQEPGMGALPWLCNLLLLLLRGPILGGSIFAIGMVLLSSLIWAAVRVFYRFAGAGAAMPYGPLEKFSWPLLACCSLFASLVLLVLRRLSSRTSVIRSWTGGWLLFATFIAGVGLGIGAWLGCTGTADASLAVIHTLRNLWGITNVLSLGCLATTSFLYLRAPRPTRPSLLACFIATQLSLAFWAIIAPAVILATDRVVPAFAKFPEWERLRLEALPTIGVVWSGFLALFLAALGTWSARLVWKSKNDRLPQSSTARPPRLIVGSAVASAFMLAPLWILLAFFVTYVKGPESTLTSTLNGMAVATAPVVLTILAGGLPVIRILLAIALDAVNYFRPDAAEAQKLWPSAEQKGPLRKGADQRLRAIVNQLLSEHGAGSKLIVFAHSQGTMLAIDFLSEPSNHELLGRFSEVHLLTVGSPYTYLYQTYFPTQFECHDKRGHDAYITSWTNLYRFDDYVGTDVRQGARLGASMPENIGLGFGGHTGYFSDRRVISEVAKLVLRE